MATNTSTCLTMSVRQPCIAATPNWNTSFSPSPDSCAAHNWQRQPCCERGVQAALLPNQSQLTFAVTGLLKYAPIAVRSLRSQCGVRSTRSPGQDVLLSAAAACSTTQLGTARKNTAPH